ncbi:MAG TPA: hypothetical protein VKA84_11255 [Gemmatimonadaceae bacterium]|nr:hypothetical protein [Gemmatimonadaceae bacterium]
MTIRARALRWLALAHRVRDGDIVTSRYYPAAESWTGRDAWWLQVPVHRVQALGGGAVHLVCEAAPGSPDFHYLRVPAAFFRDHLPELDVPGDGRMVSLFLSAEPATRFRDERGAGNIDFAGFVR